jgi:hypothetical protein
MQGSGSKQENSVAISAKFAKAMGKQFGSPQNLNYHLSQLPHWVYTPKND